MGIGVEWGTTVTPPSRSPHFTQICWCLANGPLAWSSLAFSHSLIFHSYPHLTSVVIHVSPTLVVHGLRWFRNDRFTGAPPARR